MKNILLIVVDTLRPDHLGCYGYDRPTSPCLDKLAKKSTILESLWSASNFTAPAFTSLFTGLYPHQHGVFDFTAQSPKSQIFDLFQHNKTQMGGIVTFRFFKNLLNKIWGEIEAVTDTRSFDYSKNLPQAVTASSLAWLEQHGKSGPFCLFAHYDGPHLPFRLPDEYANSFDSTNLESIEPDFLRLLFPQEQEHLDTATTKDSGSMFKLLEDVNWKKRNIPPQTLQWIIDKYDASVLYNDRAIGDLLEGLEELGHANNTIVAILSDHGEEFLEHGAISHGGIHLNEEVIKTVGIIYDPEKKEQVRLTQPFSQVDIFPTLFQMADAKDIPENMLERSFSGLISSGNLSPTRKTDVFCHGKFKIAMRNETYKFIKTEPSKVLPPIARIKLFAKMFLRNELKSEIYNLAEDPFEKNNLVKNKSLRKDLDHILKEHLSEKNSEFTSLTANDEERLRIEKEMKDLGYM